MNETVTEKVLYLLHRPKSESPLNQERWEACTTPQLNHVKRVLARENVRREQETACMKMIQF